MKILMVNPTHPSTPHISAVRAWRFARELAGLGHQVVLLTGSAADGLDAPLAGFESHDWREPLVLACTLAKDSVKSSPPKRNLLRRGVTAIRMLRHGGRHGHWVREAVHTAVRSRCTFEPDVVWCTFGTLEAVLAAKRIASRLGCPWVLDVKDNWELYVPRGMRRLMSHRIKGWAAITANSRLTASMASKWHGATAAIVYSGVEREFFGSYEETPRSQAFALNLIGGIYFPALLDDFLKGVRMLMDGLSEVERPQVVLRYLGGSGELVRAATSRTLPGVAFEDLGYVPTAVMARYCRAAAANSYIAHSGGFHHKLLELLACERPVIAFPSEHRESRELATAIGNDLLVPDSPQAVARVLTEIYTEWYEHPPKVRHADGARSYSWPGQAVQLERVLSRTVAESGGRR